MRFGLSLLGCLGLACVAFVACGGDNAALGVCQEGKVQINGQCLDDIRVATNSVGLLPARAKKAAFQGSSGAFEVVDAESGDVVYEGTALGPTFMFESEEHEGIDVWAADFSDFDEPGTYFVRAGSAVSGEFVIAGDALSSALDAAMLGLYGQRCGEGVSFEYAGDDFSHGACHLEEASLERVGEDGTQDDTGGWHDAGDYGKYVRNGSFAVAFLLSAYEHFPELLEDWDFEMPERGGSVPDILDESRYQIEWILKTQLEDGSFAHKVTGLGFEGEVAPTADKQLRVFFSTSTQSTANAVATLAQASRVFRAFDEEFADTCLEAALEGQAFLDEHPEKIDSVLNDGGTGAYQGGDPDTDERAWALAEIWATTRDADRLQEVEALLVGTGMRYNFDWADTHNLAIGAYMGVDSDERSPEVVELLTRQIIQTADDMTSAALDDPFGRGFDSYYWGSAGVVTRMAYNLVLAHRIFPNEAYLDAITLRVDHVLGLNPFARSWVTGVGVNPPYNPHHRPSASDSIAAPWPGLLIGGANPEPLSWRDEYASYQQNEIAINWNTALIYALVAATGTQDDESAACVPDCLPPETDGMGGAGGAGQ